MTNRQALQKHRMAVAEYFRKAMAAEALMWKIIGHMEDIIGGDVDYDVEDFQVLLGTHSLPESIRTIKTDDIIPIVEKWLVDPDAESLNEDE
jgi:hypothetical protein